MGEKVEKEEKKEREEKVEKKEKEVKVVREEKEVKVEKKAKKVKRVREENQYNLRTDNLKMLPSLDQEQGQQLLEDFLMGDLVLSLMVEAGDLISIVFSVVEVKIVEKVEKVE